MKAFAPIIPILVLAFSACSQNVRDSGSKYLERYNGETMEELLAKRSEYRIDSILSALAQALRRKPETSLSPVESDILAVDALQQHVNNGGYAKFVRDAPEHVGLIVPALERVECIKTAAITAAALKIATPQNPATKLEQFDARFFASGENIDQRLFLYIQKHKDLIRLH